MHMPHQLHGIESEDEPLLTLWAERVVTHEEASRMVGRVTNCWVMRIDAEGLRMSDDREDGGTTDERDVKTVLFSFVLLNTVATYLSTYMHTYMHTNLRTYIHTGTYMRACVHSRTHMRAYVHTNIHSYIPTDILCIYNTL